jgi:hypothetical protein
MRPQTKKEDRSERMDEQAENQTLLAIHPGAPTQE